ncbi:MAG: LLM class flavin-dependent oxidoreductase [Acetobacteraceae bacterium]|nr:LLM class flavin-dependent oxidoreductase [Acetobacteraceae bacterium]
MPRSSMHLNLFVLGRGHHEAAWRHPLATRRPMTDLAYYRDLARTAERGLLDSLFLADILTLGIGEGMESNAVGGLEPITLLSALAGATTHLGLIGTASTTYMEPFNLARQFASLDHISGGRAGWNIVTSWAPGAERQFGREAQPSHADRYERAEEFVALACALWDSWADDAILDDPASGRFADARRIRAPNHAGPHYRVAGPLNLPRPPQGRPVLVQAGSSDTGRRFAARHAEAVFTAHLEKATALEFHRDLKALAHAEGRDPDGVIILPGLSAIIGSTEAEAKRIERELGELSDPEIGRARLSGRFGGHDFSHLPLDRPLSVEDFPAPETVQAARSRTQVITGLVARERPTLRGLLARLAGARGHYCMAGTPEGVADMMENWFRAGAADGFNLMPPILPAMLERFIDGVVPILQRRGLFRTEYAGPMLRDQYGLARPPRQEPGRIAAE